jgi:hypothetical protein
MVRRRMAAMADKKRLEFRVVFDNVDLPEEVAHRINAAVQQAALAELAAIDLEGDLQVSRAWRRPWPGPWGIIFRPLSDEALRRAGLPTVADLDAE